MMKKILLFVFLVISIAVSAQVPHPGYAPKVFTYGNQFNRLVADSALHIPRKYAFITNDNDTTPQLFAYNDTLYMFSRGSYFKAGVGGGGTTYAADETSIHLSGVTFSIKNTWGGQNSIVTVGNLTTGSYQATPIADAYIASSASWNAKLNNGLCSGCLFVGNGSNLATGVAISGDVGFNSSGVSSLVGVITAGSCTSCNLTYDAKGRITVAGNGSSSSGTPFPDNSTLIKNNADNTKLLILGAANITTATTRTLQSPDASGTIDLTSNTATLTNKTISGASNTLSNIAEGSLALTNITTANVSTSKHGFAPILPNDSTVYLNGQGFYNVPSKFSLPRKLIGIGGFTTDLLSYSSSFYYDSSTTYALIAGGVALTGSTFEVGSSQNGGIWMVNGSGTMQSNTSTNFITLGQNSATPAATNSLNAGGGVGSGGNNTSLGVLAGAKGGTGNQTINLGYRSGFYNNTSPTGSVVFTNDIFIGSFAGPDNTQISPSITNSTFIGNNINLDSNNVAIFGRANQRIILGSNGIGGPGGNTAAMNAFSPMLGQIFFNTDSGAYCMWNNSIWIKWGSGTGGGGGGGFVDPLTTNGDIMARVSGVTTRFPKGANNTVLLTDGTGTLNYSLLTDANLSGAAAIRNANLAFMPAHTRKGNTTGVSNLPVDITSAQETADLNLFTSSLQGLVPAAAGGGTTNFLRSDQTWDPAYQPSDTLATLETRHRTDSLFTLADSIPLRTPGTGTQIAFVNNGNLVIPKVIAGTGMSITQSGTDSTWTINGPTSGTSTPSTTNVVNASGTFSNSFCHWIRVGNQVTVDGGFSISALTSVAATFVNVGLPVTSNIITSTDVQGMSASGGGTVATPGFVSGDATNDKATVEWYPQNTSSQSVQYHYTYTVQ